MTHITKEQAVQLAREAGFSIDNRDAIQAAEKLCQTAFKLGRNKGLDEAKQLVVKLDGMIVNLQPHEIETSIESLKDGTP